MAESRESSGLLSLASLREQEPRHEVAQARAEAEQRARVEVERESARAKQERLRAERTALELAEVTERAEQARREAQRRAELERTEGLARDAEELRLNLKLEREARRHVELGLTSTLLRQRFLTSGAAAVCLGSWLALGVLYFGALRPAADRLLSSAQQALLNEQRARTDAQANGARLTRQNDELATRVGALERSLREERSVKSTASGVPTLPQKPGWRPPSGVTSSKPCRDDGDPLNPCLKR